MARILFYLFLILIVLFLVFFWSDGWEAIKRSKNFKKTQKTACQAKSMYRKSEKWVRVNFKN